MTARPVTTVTETEVLVPVLTLSFSADPFVRWLLPDPAAFVRTFGQLSRLHGRRIAEHGGAYALEDFRGAALWYPPSVTPDTEALREIGQEAGITRKVAAVFGELAAYEPDEPHWYLRQIGVDPAWQGRGLGGTLLAAAFEVIDRAGEAAYLEATTPGSRDLYERHGFRTLAEVSVDGSPPLWPMLREPGGTS